MNSLTARRLALGFLLVLSIPVTAGAQAKPRARELGLPIGGNAGPLDAITDVAGVEVGHTTLISGNGPLVVGKGPVRTGVTVSLGDCPSWPRPSMAGSTTSTAST